jgi:NACHT domain
VKEEPSPEQGSQLYQTEYAETKRFEHEAFLVEVVGKPAGGKHIAIIGEPGAGKTTILTKIGAWLIGQAEQQPPAPLVVAWVSLADVGDRRLQTYLQAEWLQKVCEDNFDAAWEDWKGLRQQGRVWLLLDGLDEMSGDVLAAIRRDLGQAWAQNLRVVMTCRLNQWETASNNLVNSFEVYRTLDYSYQTSQRNDQVKEFISKWFADNEKVATQIRTELDAPGKERIKDLVKNPLRLTLLCASWERDNQALPETQADLYRGFVNYLYNWKAAEFSDEVKLRQELDLALGELAKTGLNRQPINDGAVRRFRFTASEISKLWKDLPDNLLPAAKNLGWLNVVGEEAGEAVYAFYHPTFQEYFAACSIDDWDYFLPRAHIDRPVLCEGKCVPYRVFEQEWRQVILLWIGSRDEVVTDELKEEFIEKLTDFREQEGEFYYYRAYCMAAICIGEFRSSRRTDEIVEQIVWWAFGNLQSEENRWGVLHPIPWMAEAELLHTDTNRVVDSIARNVVPISVNSLHPNKDAALKSAKMLGLIGENNPRAVKALIELIRYSDELPVSFFFVRIEASKSLAKIATGNKKAIQDLKDILSVNQNKEIQTQIVSCIGTLDPKDQFAVNFFATVINDAENENDKLQAVWSILSFDEQNDIAINTLTDLVESLDDNVSYYAVKLLEQGPVITYHNEEYEYSQDEIDHAKEICRNARSVFDLLCDNVLNTSQLAFYWGLHEMQRHVESDYAGAVDELCRQLHTSQDTTALQSIIEILGKFSIGDEKVAKELIVFLKNGDFLFNVIPSTFYRLIDSSNHKQLCHLIVDGLKDCVRNSYFNQDLHFSQIYIVIWICVRKMKYQDFHQACHSENDL